MGIRVRKGIRGAGCFGKRSGGFRIGFVPTIDSAPLIVAHELGGFARQGVKISLSREAGWASLREKILHAELDGALAHASVAFAIHCGIGMVARSCVTGLVLNHSGSAITLSNELRDLGVRDARSLRGVIEAHRRARVFVFAHTFALSPQHEALRRWLRSGGIDPEHDVRLVVVPPPLMLHNLQDGFVDGFCASEPWSAMALATRQAWSPPDSASNGPARPENVFLVLHEFAQRFPEEHLAMLAALIEACHYCEQIENRPAIVRLLAGRDYLDVPESALEKSLPAPSAASRSNRPAKDSAARHGRSAGAPSPERGRWVHKHIARNGLARDCTAFRRDVTRRLFREDLFRQAFTNTHLAGHPAPADSNKSRRHDDATPANPALALRV